MLELERAHTGGCLSCFDFYWLKKVIEFAKEEKNRRAVKFTVSTEKMPEPYYSVFTSSLSMGISLCVPCFNVWESKNLSELERAIGLRVGSERVFLVSAGLFVVFFMFQGDRGWETGGIFGGHRGSREGDRPKWPAATSRNCSSILARTQKV